MIDAHFGYPDGIAAWMLAKTIGCPFVVTLRGSELLHAKYHLRRFWLRRALQAAARVITLSGQLRDFTISLGVPPEKVVTVPNGVDATIFFPRDRDECRKMLGIPGSAKVILSAGHLIALKGHHRIVRALKSLVTKHSTALLLIAGGGGDMGSYAGEIRREIASCGLNDHVRLLGHVVPERLAALMSAADIFCLASSREGWPNVVHEALACGTPVVATAVGAVPALVPSDDYGLVVAVDDQPLLEAALQRAIERPWDRHAISKWGRSRSWTEVGREAVVELRRASDQMCDAPAFT